MRCGAGLLSFFALAAWACAGCAANGYPAKRGLRWSGEARVAGATDGTALGGPAVSFRYGGEIVERPPAVREGFVEHEQPDGWLDALVGSWGGLELSAAVLTGAAEGDRTGTLALLGVRPWLSRRQSRWFLDVAKISLLGVLMPDVGLAYGLGAGKRFQLGWEIPLGVEDFQIVPALSWISPAGDQRLLASIGLRVPM